MADSSAIPFPIDFSHTWGQILIASFITTAFWGMSCLQTAAYFMIYKSDPWYLKTLVIVLLLLDTLHEVLCIQGLWEILILNFGALVNLGPIMFQVAITGIVVAIAQLFFGWRLWRYSNRNWIYPALLVLPALYEVAGTIVYTAKGFRRPVTILQSQEMASLVTAFGTVSAVVDIFISFMMCRMLWRGRSGVPMTDKLILRLLHATISTGACTVVFALVNCICAAVWPNQLYYASGEIPLASVYCNVVLANLNSRKYLRHTKNTVLLPHSNYTPPIPLGRLNEISVTVTQDTVRG